MQLLIPAWDTCFWHQSPPMCQSCHINWCLIFIFWSLYPDIGKKIEFSSVWRYDSHQVVHVLPLGAIFVWFQLPFFPSTQSCYIDSILTCWIWINWISPQMLSFDPRSCLRQPCKLGQCWPNVGTTIPTLDQRWANRHCCLGQSFKGIQQFITNLALSSELHQK